MPQPNQPTKAPTRAASKVGGSANQPPASTRKTTSQHVVLLPAGGQLVLKTSEEVVFWNDTKKRYTEDYGLAKANDLLLLGAILSQALIMFRAQNDLASTKPTVVNAAQGRIQKSAEEIRDLEKALGIDKKTREAGGQHTVADYVTRLKRAAHAKGIHIADRTRAYEHFAMGLRWRIRVLRNADPEDQREMGVSRETVIAWAEQQLAELEEKDKAWAKDKGAVFVGKL